MGTRKSNCYKSIARRCLECSGSPPVKCEMTTCSIHSIRPGVKRSQSDSFTPGGKRLLKKFKLSNLLKSIRAECMVCSGNNPQDCTSTNCDFYQWRSGTSVRHRPHLATASTPAQDGVNFDDCRELGDKAA